MAAIVEKGVIDILDLIFGAGAAGVGAGVAIEAGSSIKTPEGIEILLPSAGGGGIQQPLEDPKIIKERKRVQTIINKTIDKMIGKGKDYYPIKYTYTGTGATSGMGDIKKALKKDYAFISQIIKDIGITKPGLIQKPEDILSKMTPKKYENLIDIIKKSGLKNIPTFTITGPQRPPSKPQEEGPIPIPLPPDTSKKKPKPSDDPPPPLPPLPPLPPPAKPEDEKEEKKDDDKPKPPPPTNDKYPKIPRIPIPGIPKNITEKKIEDPKISRARRPQHWYPQYNFGGQDILKLTDTEKIEELKNYTLFDLVTPILSGDSNNLLAVQNEIQQTRRFYNTYPNPEPEKKLPPINEKYVYDNWSQPMKDYYPAPYPFRLDMPQANNYYDHFANDQPKNLNKTIDALERGHLNPDLEQIANSKRDKFSSMNIETMQGPATFSLLDGVDVSKLDNIDFMLLR